jgi:ABC-2 type transport system permease protein
MIRALFAKEMKQYRTSFLIWSLTIIVLMAATMAAMPTMLGSGGIKDLLKLYPPAFMRAFGFDLSSFEDPLGFYVVYATLYVALLGSVFSISIAATILHKEQSYGTAEFLLTKPLSRTQIFLAKLAAYLTLVVAINVLSFFAAWTCLSAFSTKSVRVGALAIVSTYSLLLSLAMGGTGFLLSLSVKRMRSLTGPAIGVVLGFYFWDMVAKITQKYEAWGWLSPFKWMDLKVTVADYAFTWWRLLLFAALIVVCFGYSLVAYRKKDILT